ncbi:TraR/DksA C4-type zinc finger protein [Hymenobacter sp. YC55]|uniref:TraR/DksA C4-type zinc finger protein n=1 Tax=Hymenobacter sp. YC55 TaxID=3034019 RepID=UPI0023F6849A|nr:TraR/DksA C4-type zinc finger protein [Hymenobacter sp. YC55]MDF7813863.1 TraR/DksA C4-type zinc finger protein [Hymenobacter sp. YC55]
MLTEQTLDIVPILQAEITATEAQIAQLQAKRVFVPPKKETNRRSRLEAINQRQLQEAALRQAINRLPQLQQLLSTFSLLGEVRCSRCEQAIPLRRLLLLPQTRLCAPCAR